MCAIAQTILRRRVTLDCVYMLRVRKPRPAYVGHRTEALAAGGNTVKLGAKWIVKNVSVRTDKGSVNYVDGFLDQMNRGSK